MNTLTLRRFIILLAVVLGSGLLVFFAQRYQVSRMNQSVLARASEAEKAGNVEVASQLYQEHLEMVPDDQEAKAKLADVLLKGSRNAAQLDRAAAIYAELLARAPGKREVRRHLAELLVERERYAQAEQHLEILIGDLGDDGELLYLLGRCQEELGKGEGGSKPRTERAANLYEQAIKNNVSSEKRLDAYQRRAFLLHGQLNRPTEAAQVIKEMIAFQPENPQVYLASGRYHRLFGNDLKRARGDFERALELEKSSPNPSPGIYLELAGLEQGARNPGEARRILEAGLKVLPREASLHEALAMLEARAGSIEKAIAALHRGLEILPDQPSLHWTLANFLAERGETANLAVQIDELKRLNYTRALIEFLEASHQINSREWAKARQTLIRLRPTFDPFPDYKARLHYMLGRCYGHLGQGDLQRDAYAQAVGANPAFLPAQISLAASLADRGEFEQAISIYRKLADQVPEVRAPLARLLIARDQQQQPGDRDWTEAELLIKKMGADSGSEAVEPVAARADLLVAQGKLAEARELLDKESLRLPKSIDLRIKAADVLRRQRQFAEAKRRLDQAEALLPEEKGKAASVRLEQARLLIAQGGPDVSKALKELAQGTTSLPQAERRRLLEALANESASLNDAELTRELWSEIAGLDPKELVPQIRLLDLAFLSKEASGGDAIKSRLEKVREIDGTDGLMTRFQECRYLMWQAESDLKPPRTRSERNQLRDAARSLLNELYSRSSWSMIPLALGRLADQELTDLEEDSRRQPDRSAERKADLDTKRREIANYYLQAVRAGQRNLAVIKRAYDLFYELGDEDKQSQLWSVLPDTGNLKSTLDLQASGAAVGQKEYGKALELAEKAVRDNPKDLKARLWLMQILVATQQQDKAEQVLRDGDPLHANPELQVILVRFLAMTRQLGKAEQALREAEARLKDQLPQGPLALARCCEVLGQTYKVMSQDEEKLKAWIERANEWYRSTERARPDDFQVTRQFVDFQIRSGQLAPVKEHLTKILADDGTKPRPADQLAWARRSLALAMLLSNDYEQTRKALDLVKPIEQAMASGGAEVVGPEDQRILARVYEAQRTQEYHERARKVVEDLVASNRGSLEDRLLLAMMYSADNEWPKARVQYEQLITESEGARSLDVLARRPDYLAQYIDELLKRQAVDRDAAELTRAQSLVEKLRQLRPTGLNGALLEARIRHAQGQPDRAAELLEKMAKDPKGSDVVRIALAKQAEDLKLLELAERLYREAMARADVPQNRLALASFLGRHDRVKEALDLCEPLWNGPLAPEATVQRLLDIVFSSAGRRDRAQVDRLAGWIEAASNQKPKSSVLIIALANLRERQGRFQEAEELYRREIEQSGGDVVALNNLAWLMTLRSEKSVPALELINRAIALRGPIPELLDTRGMIYMMAGDTRRAVQDLSRASKLDPTGPKLFHLAQAYLRASNRQDAAQMLAKAQAKGLTPEDLHPLEATAYKKVLNDLGAH
ncbi:MAG: tetratricopeptide repeat protein [Isosphaeraceae bacterium]